MHQGKVVEQGDKQSILTPPIPNTLSCCYPLSRIWILIG